ncbi:DUF4837 family protein [Bizionia saleffrena]|nr:DUF4837 family protein [Bizionia saleffrena]
MMRKGLLIVAIIVFALSCKDDSAKGQRIIPESSGALNTVAVVIENEKWEGQLGQAVRNILAAPIDGLPQEEPLFSLTQIPPQVFSGFSRTNRIIIKIQKGKAGTTIEDNVYARPQKFIVVSGQTIQEIEQQLQNNAKMIVSAFKVEEIAEKQRRIRKSMYPATHLKEKLGVDIQYSTAYRISKEEDNFFWMRKDIPTGYTNLLVYEIPLSKLKGSDSVVSQIIKIRDSIGEKYIPGPTEGSYMITEKAYAPHLFKTTLNNKPAWEVKGVWDVKNAFMSGPFITYIIEDKANNRYVVAEGFAYAPSIAKREHIFELEAMIKSIKLE